MGGSRWEGRWSRSRPSTSILPLVGWYSRLTQLNSVVLPAPFGPMSAQIWPSSIVNDRSASATTPPNSTLRSSTDNKATGFPPREKAEARRDVAANQTGSQTEQRVETDREPRHLGDLAHREQHTGHERGPIVRIVADRQGLARGAQQDLLVRDHTAHPNGVHVTSVDQAAPPPRRHDRVGRGRGQR